ncbi:hypothetical protein N7512_001835 [Penicillium capsulatum]|nr:hypothetical protein N7512_001835 [Penicillium capsulatum]
MTTGRINQITRVRRGAARGARGPGESPPSTPRRGQSAYRRLGRAERRPPRPPRRTGDGAGGHPIAPTKPLSAGPHADGPSPPLWQAGGRASLRHTALGRRVRTPRSRRRTAATAGRLPPGISVSGVASGHPSTDPISAGHLAVPGLRPPRPAPGAR